MVDRLSSYTSCINCWSQLSQHQQICERDCSASKFFLNLKSKLRKQNEISPKNKRGVAHKNNNENLWVETIFWWTKTSECGQKPSRFCICKPTFISVHVPQQNSVFVSICCHQSLKKNNSANFCFVRMHKTKLHDCVEEFYKAGPNASAKFFFWRVLSKKKTYDLRKELKTMSITKQSEWFFGLFVYYKLADFFCSPSFVSWKSLLLFL